MNTLPAQEIKRRGVKAIEMALKKGPVHIIKNNSPTCVVLTEAQYAQLTTPVPTLKTEENNFFNWLLQKKASGGKTRKELDSRLTKERDEWDG